MKCIKVYNFLVKQPWKSIWMLTQNNNLNCIKLGNLWRRVVMGLQNNFGKLFGNMIENLYENLYELGLFSKAMGMDSL